MVLLLLFFLSFFFSPFPSIGCHMEEGKNLFDFLLAMIPILSPTQLRDTPSDSSRWSQEARLVSHLWNTDWTLPPKSDVFTPPSPSSMYFFCLVRIGGYMNQQTLTRSWFYGKAPRSGPGHWSYRACMTVPGTGPIDGNTRGVRFCVSVLQGLGHDSLVSEWARKLRCMKVGRSLVGG